MYRSVIFVCLMTVGLPGRALAQIYPSGQMYGKWTYSEKNKYYYCIYRYKSRPQLADYDKEQLVIYMPGKEKNYVYWYNPDTEKIWARNPTKRHPILGKQVADGADLWSVRKATNGGTVSDAIRAEWPETKKTNPPVPGVDPTVDTRTIPCPPDPTDLPG